MPDRPVTDRNAERAHRPLCIAISGSYGGLNLGDEAILESIVAQLRRSFPVEITVFTRNPEDTLQRHEVDRAVAIRELTLDEARAEVERLDLLVLGGGGLLYDADAEAYLREVILADESDVPVVVYAVSAGPLKDPAVRNCVRESLKNVAVVTVRDRQGRRLLEEVGVRRDIVVTADPALLLERKPLPDDVLMREGLDPGARLVGFSVREPGPAAPDIDAEHYHMLLANTADFMVARLDAHIVFVPMERGHMDMPPLKNVSLGQLIADIDRSWDMRQHVRERIERLLPGLQERARETHHILERLLMEHHPSVDQNV